MSRQIKAPQRCNYAFLFAYALSVAKKKKTLKMRNLILIMRPSLVDYSLHSG